MRQMEEIVRGDGGVATLPRRGGGAARLPCCARPRAITVIESKLRPPALAASLGRPAPPGRAARRAQPPAADGDHGARGVRQDHAPRRVDRAPPPGRRSRGCRSTRATTTPPGCGATSPRPCAARGRLAGRRGPGSRRRPGRDRRRPPQPALRGCERGLVIVLDDHHALPAHRFGEAAAPRSCSGCPTACAWSSPAAARPTLPLSLLRARGRARRDRRRRAAPAACPRPRAWPAAALGEREVEAACAPPAAGRPAWRWRCSPAARATCATTSPTRCWPRRTPTPSASSS